MFKKVILLALFILFYTITHAQYGWMMGTWKSRNGAAALSGNITNTIQVDNVSGESFTGSKTSERNDASHAKITISIAGFFRGKILYLQNGSVVHKEPETSQWDDCSACTQDNKLIISRDSIVLINNISGCNNKCDEQTVYYRLLSEFDSTTERELVDRFGRPSDIIGFQPFHAKEDKPITPNDNNEEEKRRRDSLANIERIKQQADDDVRLAQQKKREQQIADSLNLVKQKDQQRIKDSLDNVARIRQQQINDSALLAQQKKRQQQIADSLNLVKQREQQRIKDSLDNVVRIRQQQINDSTLLAQQKKRQQEIADSLDLVNKREQQRIKDSLQNVAATNLQKQRTADSLRNIQAKKRQQEIADSLATARKQQYNDSLQKAALATVDTPRKDTSQSGSKALTSRTSVLLETYHINSPDILIELFDNGEIDGDRVSVYHNNTIIVSNQTLGTKPITLNIHANATNRDHEFVLVAENLGSIPPNSALMRITAGKQVYKLMVNTDMKTNARIVFYYDGN